MSSSRWYRMNNFRLGFNYSRPKYTKTVLSLWLLLSSFCLGLAQEGTKQLAPQESDLLYLLIYGSSGTVENNNFGSYVAEDRERIYVYLNAGETMYYGMRMDSEQPRFGILAQTSFRVKDPDGNIVVAQTRFPRNGDFGFIRNYTEAVTGPTGVIKQGQFITNGYSPLSYTALTSGNHYIEFETWADETFTVRQRRETAIQFFDVTVVDAQLNVISNPDAPDRSAGRLWSRQWSLTTKSFTRNPVNAAFFIYTNDGFVNKVRYEMFPFEFDFVSNSFGVANTNDAFENRRSFNGNAFLNDVSEHQIFLNDPDQSAFRSASVFPAIIASFNGVKIFDYDQTRTPKVLDTNNPTINIARNDTTNSNCPHRDEVIFLIESNTRAQIQILLDIDGNGFDPTGIDRVLYADLEPGTNQFPWDLRDGEGNLTDPGNFNAQIDVLFSGITHFPLFDVERMDSVITETIRPFPREANEPPPTLFWDDTNIEQLVIDPSSGIARLRASDPFLRKWSLISTTQPINGNGNTLNSWFSGLEASANFNYTVVLTSGCSNRDHDRDNISDLVDIDDDNDGITDMAESPNSSVDPSADDDGDGILNYEDADQPGFTDVNTDGVDDTYDFDLDGVPNFLDLDSDNDGIMDVIEAGGIDVDTNGIIFALTILDIDRDGLDDRVDPEIFSRPPGFPLPNADTDQDGQPNFLDLDSDNDGIPDNREGQTTLGYNAPSEILGDSDLDGLNDTYDAFFNQYNETEPFGSFGAPISTGNVILPVNTDTIDELDYVDSNSDNDPSPDWLEGFDDDENGVTLIDLQFRASDFRQTPGNAGLYPEIDTDNNGIFDWLDDEDMDQIPNFLDPDHPTFYLDRDQDGLIDLYDRSNSGLGYGEASGGFSEPDNDRDTRPNYRDIEPLVTTCLQIPVTTFTGNLTVCPGQTLSLTADEVDGMAYTWRRGDTIIGTERNLLIANAGPEVLSNEYTLEVTNGYCTFVSEAFTVDFAPLPNLDINVAIAEPTICKGSQTTIFVLNPEPNVVYQLQLDTLILGQAQVGTGDTLSFPTGIVDTTGQVVLNILASKDGCDPVPLNQQAILDIPLLPQTNLSLTSPDTLICQDNAGIIVEIANTESDVQYQVRLGADTLSAFVPGNGATLLINTLAIPSLGINELIVQAQRDSCEIVSLEDTLSITVFSEPLTNLNIRASSDNICEDNSGILVTIDNSEVDALYQLQLDGEILADTMGNGATIEIPTGPIAEIGESTIFVLASKPSCDPRPLDDSLNILVFEGPNPNVTIVASEVSLCLDNQGTTISLDSSQVGVDYQLAIGDQVLGNPLTGNGGTLEFTTEPITTIGVTQITVQAIKPGCQAITLNDTTEVTVFSDEPSQVSIEIIEGSQAGSNRVCSGDSVTFQAVPFNGGVSPSFQWSVNGNIVEQDSPELTISSLQDQDVVSVDMRIDLSCDSLTVVSNNLAISVEPAPVLNISADLPRVAAGCDVRLEVTGASNYTWEPADQVEFVNADGSEVSVQPQQTTTYIVTGTNANGCSVRDSIVVEVLPAQDVFVPSLFSPNADGNNDRFIIHGECISEVILQVFDRTGNLVYEATTLEEATQIGWDGTHNGKAQPIGKYLWSLRGKTTDGQSLQFQGRNTGPINLLR